MIKHYLDLGSLGVGALTGLGDAAIVIDLLCGISSDGRPLPARDISATII